MTELPIEGIVRIQQMQARYGHLVDARDWDGFRERVVTRQWPGVER